MVDVLCHILRVRFDIECSGECRRSRGGICVSMGVVQCVLDMSLESWDKTVCWIRLDICVIGVGEVELDVSDKVDHGGCRIIAIGKSFGDNRPDKILGSAMSREPWNMCKEAVLRPSIVGGCCYRRTRSWTWQLREQNFVSDEERLSLIGVVLGSLKIAVVVMKIFSVSVFSIVSVVFKVVVFEEVDRWIFILTIIGEWLTGRWDVVEFG